MFAIKYLNATNFGGKFKFLFFMYNIRLDLIYRFHAENSSKYLFENLSFRANSLSQSICDIVYPHA